MLGRRALVVAALLAPLLAAAQGGTAAKKIRVAVLEIRPLGTEASKAELLSEVALTEAAGMPGFDVIGRSDINSLIGFEKQKQVMGCSDDSACLAEIGGALGVDLILVGSLGKIGTLYRLDIKLVETKKARVRSRVGVTVEGSEEKLVAAIQKAVRDLLGPEARPPEPVAAARPAGAAPAAEGKPAPSLAAQPPKAPPPVPAAGVSASAGTSRRTWAYVAGGTGLALLAGGAAAGLSAKAAYDDEKAAADAGDLEAYEDAKSKAKSMSTVADGLFVAGAIGVGVGTWLYFTSRPPAGVAVHLAPTPGGAFASIAGGF
jgi:hypothetical protein